MSFRFAKWLYTTLYLFVSLRGFEGKQEVTISFITEDLRNVTISYKSIGCYKDTYNDRALPIMIKDLRRLKPDVMISSCAKLAWSRGYVGFGVQFYGECWSGKEAVLRYDMYNTSNGCGVGGIGGHWSNNIYFLTNATPIITSRPRPWKGTSWEFVQLKCQIKSPFDVQVTWYRNDEEKPLYTGKIFRRKIRTQEQGYYRCIGTTPYGVQVQSDKVLVILKDFFTSIVQFQLKEKSRSKRSEMYCSPCDQIVDRLTDTTSMQYNRGTCKTWSSEKQVEVQCTLYRHRNNQDLTTYYNTLIRNLRQAARSGNLAQIKWRSIEVFDTEYCVPQATGNTDLQGVFSWPLGMPDHSATIGCPYGPSDVNGTRACAGDFIRGVKWSSPDVERCRFDSLKANDLNELTKITVNALNSVEVAKNLTKLIKSYKVEELTASDADVAAQLIHNIVDNKGTLKETAGSVLGVVDTIMKMNRTVIAENEDISSRLTATLDNLAQNIPLSKEKRSMTFNTSNLVLQVTDVSRNNFNGTKFTVTTRSTNGRTSIKLPSSVLRKSTKQKLRIGFIYYANNKFFQPMKGGSEEENNTIKTSKEVLSASVYSVDTSSLDKPVVLRFPKPVHDEEDRILNSSCVFWDQEAGTWSGLGCRLCESNQPDAEAVECCCHHLTSFAVLFSPGNPKPSTSAYTKHARTLSIITYVGCAISLVGVVLTFFTYLLFRHLRKTSQQYILMNLCIAIAALLIVFLAGINSTNKTLACQIVAVLLHYLTLVTVLWMGIEAYNLYLQIVKVMAIYQSKFMMKAALVGWGVPMVIVTATIISAVVEDKTSIYGSEYACVLSETLYRAVTLFAPVLLILVFNLIIFILVIYKLNSTGSMIQVSTKSQQRRRCWTALAIMCLLGLTWLFGALAISDARIVFEYLFCIFNSLQGFFIFFFHCVRIKEVRSQWSYFVSGLGFSHRESVTSHNRSKGFGESQHSSEGFIRVREWLENDCGDQLQRKGTVLTHMSLRREDNDNSAGNNNC